MAYLGGGHWAMVPFGIFRGYWAMAALAYLGGALGHGTPLAYFFNFSVFLVAPLHGSMVN